MLFTHKELQQKIEEMEKKYDHQFSTVFVALCELIILSTKPQRKIGFERKDR